MQKGQFSLAVLHSPYQEDGLLGLDFLQANKYVLSADSGLRLNNKKYSTIVQKVPFRVIRVSCQQTLCLPAYSEMVIPGTCDKSKCKELKQGLVSPLAEDCPENFIVGHTLVDPKRKDMDIPVRVMNTTNEDITIPAGMTLGTISGVSDESLLCDKTGTDSAITGESVQSTLPEHLSELYQVSSKIYHHKKNRS